MSGFASTHFLAASSAESLSTAIERETEFWSSGAQRAADVLGLPLEEVVVGDALHEEALAGLLARSS